MEHVRYSTLDINSGSQPEQKMFFGSGHGIARYDIVKYPIFTKLDDKMESLFWRPVEVDMSMEKASFNKMTEAGQFIFTSNLQRQIVLDSIQGRSPGLTFLPYVTNPELENCLLTKGFFEKIHSKSYTHIIQSVYDDPSVVFDGIPQVTEIVQCATSITQAFDRMQQNPTKENLYLALIADNALEAIRFYISFACSFALAENGYMSGSANVLKLIARDEGQHMALDQHILKLLPKDDPEFIQIIGDNANAARKIFEDSKDEEREWCKYLFSNGSFLGLNEHILGDLYLEGYLYPRRLAGAGLSIKGTKKIDHPIPWVEKWYSAKDIQAAPQETEITEYLSGALTNNLEEMEFSFG